MNNNEKSAIPKLKEIALLSGLVSVVGEKRSKILHIHKLDIFAFLIVVDGVVKGELILHKGVWCCRKQIQMKS